MHDSMYIFMAKVARDTMKNMCRVDNFYVDTFSGIQISVILKYPISYLVILEVIVCKDTSALLYPKGAFKYLLSIFSSRPKSLSLASSTGFVASLP